MLAVLPIAVWYGLGYAIAVSVASMLAFNFFFLPPLHTLAMTDSENWVDPRRLSRDRPSS